MLDDNIIIKLVFPQVEHGQELSWLSELRKVCVLFINLDPGKPLDPVETLNLLQTSFDAIYPCLKKFEGRLHENWSVNPNLFMYMYYPSQAL